MEESVPGDPISRSWAESSTHTLRSRGLPRPSSCPAATADRHWVKSLRTLSRRDSVLSLRRHALLPPDRRSFAIRV
ncbi:hypothetical protein A0H81_03630 [Grifola frondosa]|uniref:Uncharacterized protein n=1 Tax=Grifola frondosa TaxID=5627 RepID=A0A1C7MKE2_GRIFR|nr:hypothetical protein A0H81_03630 [Grifola frondosa]